MRPSVTSARRAATASSDLELQGPMKLLGNNVKVLNLVFVYNIVQSNLENKPGLSVVDSL